MQAIFHCRFEFHGIIFEYSLKKANAEKSESEEDEQPKADKDKPARPRRPRGRPPKKASPAAE